MFSDKTGTLTRNLMEFKICSIGGVKFGRLDTDVPASASPQVRCGAGCSRPRCACATAGYLSFGPIEKAYYDFCDLSVREKDWRGKPGL